MITQIEQALLRCSGDKFANISRLYLSYKYELVYSTGFVKGKEKSKKGTPDNFVLFKDYYIYNEITTQETRLDEKLKKDIAHCFKQKDIPINRILKIVLICNGEITPKLLEDLTNYKNNINKLVELEVIGVDTFANIIFKDYPSLGKELDIPIDTGQILELNDFVRQYEKSKFATPLTNHFFNREKELKEGSAYLESEDIILISGQAGVGKTKFSLKLVEEYRNKYPSYHVKYVKANGNQGIWEDLKIQLIKENNYLLVIDDANKLKTNLESILNFKNVYNKEKIKLIFTVRNYLKSEVDYLLKDFLLIELKNFEKDELKDILTSTDFNITNYYADKIYSISKGNSRIAIMAAKAGINNDIEKINNASIILEEYFSSVNQSIKSDTALLKVAGVLSVFRIIDFSNTKIIEEIKKYFNISENILREKLDLLYKNEIADEYKNTYKIADQILGEYIFYLVFIKEKYLSFKLLLEVYFDEHKILLMDILSPIVSNYGFEEIKSKIHNDVLNKWKSIDCYNKKLKYLKDFWFYLPTETLLFLNKSISNKKKCDINKYLFTIYDDNRIGAYDDEIIDILINFQQFPDKFGLALEILFKYGLSTQELFSKLLKALTQSFAYGEYSYETKYNIPIKVFDYLYSKVSENEDFYSRIILFIATKYLIDSYQVISSEGLKFYIGEKLVCLTTEQKKFRHKLWDFIFNCYKNNGIKEYVYEFFENHHYSMHVKINKSVIKFDRDLITEFIKDNFSNKSYKDVYIVYEYTEELKNADIEYDIVLDSKIQNKDFEIWLLLYETVHENKNNLLFEKIKDYGLEDYITLLNSINNIYKKVGYEEFSQNFSIVYHSIYEMFVDLARKDFDLFLQVLEKLFEYDYFVDMSLGNIFIKLDYDLPKTKKLKDILQKNTKIENIYISLLVNIPKDFITIEDYLYYYKLLQDQNTNHFYFWCIDSILEKLENLELDLNQEVSKIIDIIYQKIKTSNAYLDLRDSLFNFIYNKYPSVFIKKLDIIKKIYLYFNKKNNYFDNNLNILKCILVKSPNFIIKLLKSKFNENTFISRNDLNVFNFCKLWELNNPEEIFINIIKYFNGSLFILSNTPSAIVSLFRGNNKQESDFLLSLISISDKRMLRTIFNVIVCKFKDKKFEFLLKILKKDNDLEFFKTLDLYMLSTIYSGSGIPRMEYKISELEKTIDFFQSLNDMKYLEHIKYLEDTIMYTKIEIEYERKREFINKWSV